MDGRHIIMLGADEKYSELSRLVLDGGGVKKDIRSFGYLCFGVGDAICTIYIGGGVQEQSHSSCNCTCTCA